MLYLEDYIELIEQLPQDLRDRFTEMRELDLKVQNTIDLLDTRVRRFFSDSRKNKPDIIEEEYKSIHSTYKAALDDADEKVSMASQIYDLVDRHLRKLDQELGRFKMELEADCSGITETLEKNVKKTSAFSDDITFEQLSTYALNNFDDKKRLSSVDRISSFKNGSIDKHYSGLYSSPLGANYPLINSPKMSRNSSLSINNLKKQDGSGTFHSSLNGSMTANKSLLHHDTKEEGRGAQASLKAMTAAQKKAEQLGNSLSMSGLLATAASKQTPTNPNSSSSFVDVTSHSHMFGATTPTANSSLKQTSLQSRLQKSNNRRAQKSMLSGGEKSSYPEPSLDWVPDPNEPTYCLCNQVSYGEMVGCDNASCPIEWFHYGCVGLTDAPKGKWYCPDCAAQIKRKRVR